VPPLAAPTATVDRRTDAPIMSRRRRHGERDPGGGAAGRTGNPPVPTMRLRSVPGLRYNRRVSHQDEAPGDVDHGLVPRTVADELRTPRAAGVAGVIFAVVIIAVEILIHQALPTDADQASWITDEARRRQMTWALTLVPYAGIAFLWFIGVIRARLGNREDKLFATTFLGSGLLFVAMLFVSAAALGALITLQDGPHAATVDEVRLFSATAMALLTTFGIRMAAVFTLVVTNLGRRARIVPGWLQVVGYAAALVLLLAPPRTFWAVILFPLWVLLISAQILVSGGRAEPADGRPT